MNCIWLIIFQISIYFIICIDTQHTWWNHDEFDDTNYLMSEQKTMHRHRHHHQLTRQSVRQKFMADEVHTVDFPLTHVHENGNELQNQKIAHRNGNRQSNKKHNIRRGQRQKQYKNGNQTRRDPNNILDFLILFFFFPFLHLFLFPQVFVLCSAHAPCMEFDHFRRISLRFFFLF